MTITYKCSSCGAAMEFNALSQTLKCNHCGFEISVAEYESQNKQIGPEAEQQPERSETIKTYHCQSCGAELITDEHTSATICGFCGNPTLVEDRLSGTAMPSQIIPFKIDKEKAKEIYKKWLKKGPLTPKQLSSTAVIEKMTGVYVPFWLHDYTAEDFMNASATRVRTETRGDYRYVYTDHYDIYRDVKADFTKIPTDASEKMPNAVMDKLEPFEYKDLTKFQMPYLSGYQSEKYSQNAEETEGRAKGRVQDYITNITRESITGYATVIVTNNQVHAKSIDHQYTLFPVWILNYRYQNQDSQVMINGQTGKIVADRPVSKGRAAAWFLGVFAGVLAILEIGGLLFL